MTDRECFSFIHMIMNCDDLTLKEKHAFTKYTKKEVRDRLKEQDRDYEYHDLSDDGSEFYIKEYYDEPFTEEEKLDYIEANWRRITAPWDCTGQTFSRRIRIINLKEPNSLGVHAIVYHFMAIDC